MRWTRAGLLALSVLLIGGTDYLTGPDIGFSLFYLVPIVWAAWYGTQSTAMLLAVLAYTCWMGAEASFHGFTAVTVWNGLTRLGIYAGFAWLTFRVREDDRALRALNVQLQQLLEQEQHLSRTDSLTNLPNRRMFLDELRRASARIHRTGRPIAVAYIDLDCFKSFNDRLGHAAGDAVLRRVADVLALQVRGTDVAARLGGAQFGVLLDRCGEDTARVIATRLLDQLTAALVEASGREIGVCIGVACFMGASFTPEAMIDHADAAMYCAKGQGTNRIYITQLGGGAGAVGAAAISG